MEAKGGAVSTKCCVRVECSVLSGKCLECLLAGGATLGHIDVSGDGGG